MTPVARTTTTSPSSPDLVGQHRGRSGQATSAGGSHSMPAADEPTTAAVTWVRVCHLDQLVPGRGGAAKVAGRQIALFRLPGSSAGRVGYGNDDGDPSDPAGDHPVVDDRPGRSAPDDDRPVDRHEDQPVVDDRDGRIPPGGGDVVYAVDNRDPFSGAHVLSRGIVGDKAGVPKVASPVYKQSFDLRTGRCLDDDTVVIAAYPVRVDRGGWVEVEVPG
jgi:NAD(P)H-dependent nitrite reductase small subunit